MGKVEFLPVEPKEKNEEDPNKSDPFIAGALIRYFNRKAASAGDALFGNPNDVVKKRNHQLVYEPKRCAAQGVPQLNGILPCSPGSNSQHSGNRDNSRAVYGCFAPKFPGKHGSCPQQPGGQPSKRPKQNPKTRLFDFLEIAFQYNFGQLKKEQKSEQMEQQEVPK